MFASEIPQYLDNYALVCTYECLGHSSRDRITTPLELDRSAHALFVGACLFSKQSTGMPWRNPTCDHVRTYMRQIDWLKCSNPIGRAGCMRNVSRGSAGSLPPV